MTRDLSSLLHDFADAQGRASAQTAPPAAQEARTIGRLARRRRTVRTGATALTSAAVVVGLAVGVQALTAPEPTPPAHTTPAPRPTPEPTPEPTREPSAGPEPTASATPDAPSVTVHPALPTAQALVPGVVESSRAGWHLVTYTIWESAGDDAPEVPISVHYLADPGGQLYEVPLVTDAGTGVLDWLQGTPRVLVQAWTEVPQGVQVRDLRSGEVLATIAVAEGETVMNAGLTADGGVVARVNREGTSETRAYSPDGTLVATQPAPDPYLSLDATRSFLLDRSPYHLAPVVRRTSDLTSVRLALPETGEDVWSCGSVVHWLGTGLAVGCRVPAGPDAMGIDMGRTEFWRVPPDGGASSPLFDGEDDPASAEQVVRLWEAGEHIVGETVDDTVALLGPNGAIASELVAGYVLGTAGDRVTVSTYRQGGVVSVDAGTGEAVVLAPHIPGSDVTGLRSVVG